MSRNTKILIILLILFIISFFASLFSGSVFISPFELFSNSDSLNGNLNTIFYDIRLPRTLNAVLIGSALSCSGIILQTILRNNLAEPGLLGISAGAGFGAIILFILPYASFYLTAPASFVSALATTLVIFYISKGLNSKYTNFLSSNKIILAGIAINALLSSVNAFLLIYSGKSLTHIIYWLSGGLSGRGWNEFLPTFIFVLAGVIIAVLMSKEYNVLSLGNELSVSLGLNVKKVQNISIAVSSILAASAVSVAGIISFVGLIVPNIAKLLLGSDHRYSIPGSILLGSVFLLVSDIIARTVISPSEIPVGIVTSFIGAPIFIWLIIKKGNGE
ncbi:MAG: iron ABC transporter permease [Bacteroidetes bacterium]|nr:iron ABC transporter permease [Bacteroidota bacterium]